MLYKTILTGNIVLHNEMCLFINIFNGHHKIFSYPPTPGLRLPVTRFSNWNAKSMQYFLFVFGKNHCILLGRVNIQWSTATEIQIDTRMVVERQQCK